MDKDAPMADAHKDYQAFRKKYEGQLIFAYQAYSTEELLAHLKMSEIDRDHASANYRRTGWAHHKENKERFSRNAEVYKFVLAHRDGGNKNAN
ncbi:MAG: hypothetical protein P8P29_04840 [Flavobacteriaceae bacterium]|nr:hypothetical protein [Flavobacteriaceae bacterium]